MNSTLYLLNDDHHSFEDVIRVLRKYLSYPMTQGQSIAQIVHNNGKCDIYTGDMVMVENLYQLFLKDGFNVEIGENYEME
jgi:ATP-dependent Clp protease adapter protein ClpS|tara:strand:- start:383 stop:622 length:240 start_codon:yes stop_codon:yes gene_type:complete